MSLYSTDKVYKHRKSIVQICHGLRLIKVRLLFSSHLQQVVFFEAAGVVIARLGLIEPKTKQP